MNIIAYILYLALTWLITVYVGLRFYRHGHIYILRLLHGDEKLTRFINRLLLTGYYLLNLGYAALMLSNWKTVGTWSEWLGSVVSMTGRIMLSLAIIHFVNMALIFRFSRRHQPIPHHKKHEK